MLGKDAKICMPSCNPAGHQLTFLDIRILALLDEQLFHSAYSIAEALGTSNSTILSDLRESLDMTFFMYVGSRTS
jgi:hypothetical protein